MAVRRETVPLPLLKGLSTPDKLLFVACSVLSTSSPLPTHSVKLSRLALATVTELIRHVSL